MLSTVIFFDVHHALTICVVIGSVLSSLLRPGSAADSICPDLLRTVKSNNNNNAGVLLLRHLHQNEGEQVINKLVALQKTL